MEKVKTEKNGKNIKAFQITAEINPIWIFYFLNKKYPLSLRAWLIRLEKNKMCEWVTCCNCSILQLFNCNSSVVSCCNWSVILDNNPKKASSHNENALPLHCFLHDLLRKVLYLKCHHSFFYFFFISFIYFLFFYSSLS